MRKTEIRRAGRVAVILPILVLCAACAPRQHAEPPDVVSAVEQADSRVAHADAESGMSGFASGWVVDVALSGSDPVTPEELSGLLLAVRHAGDGNPDYVRLYATDASGSPLDLTAPAEQLGIRVGNRGRLRRAQRRHRSRAGQRAVSRFHLTWSAP
ncbi:hypothetical protein [Microbacterium sp. SORGH_AS_0428]|uniref:hypothetical protein n=1 Tax=Microbacterium sp. SORGH_AS_0428 TaxID=3041788 RepID=UPI00286C4305|nr:hypothetical protein [Microbacterium sp. SORGH_AS_0428]